MLPVVADTVYVVFHAEIAEWMANLLSHAAARRGVKVQAGAITAGGVLPPQANWRAWAGQLRGLSGAGFDYVVGGCGPRTDVRVLIGAPDTRDGKVWGPRWRRLYLLIGSSVLWRGRGAGQGAYDVTRATIDALATAADGWIENAPADEEVQPSRLDLCADHWGHAWTLADLDRFAARQGRRGHAKNEDSDIAPDVIETPTGWAWKSRTGTTLYLGCRGRASRFLRLYDKTAEAAASGKLPWLEPIWREHGWEPGVQVWRAEVEHGAEWLRSHGMPTLAEMRDAERVLWEHYTTAVRHTPGKTAQLRHEASSPVWSALQRAATSLSAGAWKWKPRKASAKGDMAHLAKMAAGCLAAIEDELCLGAAAVTVDTAGKLAAPVRSDNKTRRRALGWAGAALAAKRAREEVCVPVDSAAPAQPQPAAPVVEPSPASTAFDHVEVPSVGAPVPAWIQHPDLSYVLVPNPEAACLIS